jgi:hypothetical protein
MTYGKLTLIRVVNKGKKPKAEFKCVCGKTKIIRIDSVNEKSSCGCGRKKYPEIGTKFNKLTYIKIATDLLRKDKRKVSRGFFRCDCGKEKIYSIYTVKYGTTKSCGCVKIAKDGSAFNKIYGQYKRGAISRNHEFKLTKDEFNNLLKSICFYCGCNPSQTVKSRSSLPDLIYNGIDRINNSKGYTLDNCVACCRWCNASKSNLTSEYFINKCKEVATKWTK